MCYCICVSHSFNSLLSLFKAAAGNNSLCAYTCTFINGDHEGGQLAKSLDLMTAKELAVTNHSSSKSSALWNVKNILAL